jgi:hypothetical protein
MRIQVRRTGGFGFTPPGGEYNTTTPPDAHEWHALAERAVAAGHSAPSTGVPDGFHYEITVDGKTVHTADPRLTDDQRELISRVLKEGA